MSHELYPVEQGDRDAAADQKDGEAAEEASALAWLAEYANTARADCEKAQAEVTTFEAMAITQPPMEVFAENWRISLRGALKRCRIAAALQAVVADRDEWRTQHENLLSVRQSDLARIANTRASPDVEGLVERLRGMTADSRFDIQGVARHLMNEASDALTRLSSPRGGDVEAVAWLWDMTIHGRTTRNITTYKPASDDGVSNLTPLYTMPPAAALSAMQSRASVVEEPKP